MGLVTAEAETVDVCGWLIPLLKGLNNHEGANLDLLLLDVVLVDVVVDAEREDCMDRIDDWEGEVPKLLKASLRSRSSGGSSDTMNFGLSSIGGIVRTLLDSWADLFSFDRYEEDMTVPLPEDATEFRLTEGGLILISRFNENMSKSNLSASILVMASVVSPIGVRAMSLSERKGIPILDPTS